MSKNQIRDTEYYWYAPSIIVGVFIAFLMFNDIITALLFGVPIGLMFGYTITSASKKGR